jgi:hypothetical protein
LLGNGIRGGTDKKNLIGIGFEKAAFGAWFAFGDEACCLHFYKKRSDPSHMQSTIFHIYLERETGGARKVILFLNFPIMESIHWVPHFSFYHSAHEKNSPDHHIIPGHSGRASSIT